MYGTNDSLKEIIKNALSHNDPLKVNMKLAGIFESSDKFEVMKK